MSKLHWSELLALSIQGTVGQDSSQLLWDLGMRKMDIDFHDAPKPPVKGSTLMVVSGPHKGRLATMGIAQDFTPTSVNLLVQFTDNKFAVLDSTEVQEILPPQWQQIDQDGALDIGSMLWGAAVKNISTDGEPQISPRLTVFDGSKPLEALIADGYTKWLKTKVHHA